MCSWPISWHRATREPQPQRRALVWIQARQKHALSVCDRPKVAKSAPSGPGPGRIRPVEAAEQRRVGRYWLVPDARVRNWRGIPSWRSRRIGHQAGIRRGWTPAASVDVLSSEEDMTGFLNDRANPHLPHALFPSQPSAEADHLPDSQRATSEIPALGDPHRHRLARPSDWIAFGVPHRLAAGGDLIDHDANMRIRVPDLGDCTPHG